MDVMHNIAGPATNSLHYSLLCPRTNWSSRTHYTTLGVLTRIQPADQTSCPWPAQGEQWQKCAFVWSAIPKVNLVQVESTIPRNLRKMRLQSPVMAAQMLLHCSQSVTWRSPHSWL